MLQPEQCCRARARRDCNPRGVGELCRPAVTHLRDMQGATVMTSLWAGCSVRRMPSLRWPTCTETFKNRLQFWLGS